MPVSILRTDRGESPGTLIVPESPAAGIEPPEFQRQPCGWSSAFSPTASVPSARTRHTSGAFWRHKEGAGLTRPLSIRLMKATRGSACLPARIDRSGALERFHRCKCAHNRTIGLLAPDADEMASALATAPVVPDKNGRAITSPGLVEASMMRLAMLRLCVSAACCRYRPSTVQNRCRSGKSQSERICNVVIGCCSDSLKV